MYTSATGNTKKVAEAMAAALGGEACLIGTEQSPVECDLLFLGGAIYKSDLLPAMKNFLNGLEPKKVARVALFCTSVMGEKANLLMRALLKNRGITVLPETYSCRGKFLWMNRKSPNEDELLYAREFAARLAKGLK